MLDLLAFGPHPDDVEICAAGTLLKVKARGGRVGIVDLTAGEMGTRGSREIRAAETAEATRRLGLEFRRCLDLGDGRLREGREPELAVVRVLRELRPAVVLAPWGVDDHPDHEHAARIIRNACFQSGMGKVETGQPPHRPRAILAYPGRREFTPSFVVDITPWWDERLHAARAYKSQFHDPASTEPATAISSPDFWHFIEARAMYYGQLIGTRYGEAFWTEGTLEIEDPLAHFARGGGPQLPSRSAS
jgi:bacillithiol biosynthesis deacetylase BshB1